MSILSCFLKNQKVPWRCWPNLSRAWSLSSEFTLKFMGNFGIFRLYKIYKRQWDFENFLILRCTPDWALTDCPIRDAIAQDERLFVAAYFVFFDYNINILYSLFTMFTTSIWCFRKTSQYLIFDRAALDNFRLNAKIVVEICIFNGTFVYFKWRNCYPNFLLWGYMMYETSHCEVWDFL